MVDNFVFRKSPDVARLKRQHEEIVNLIAEQEALVMKVEENDRLICYLLIAQVVITIGLIILVYLY